MGLNKPADFSTAKLLKEKGFDKICEKYYPDDGSLLNVNEGSIRHIAYRIQAPTVAEVVMWLYEKYGIWISVDMVFEEEQTGFWYCIRQSKIDDFDIQSDEYPTITEAYEAAIEYTLKNLI